MVVDDLERDDVGRVHQWTRGRRGGGLDPGDCPGARGSDYARPERSFILNNQTNRWGHFVMWGCGPNPMKRSAASPFGRANRLLSMLIHVRFAGPVENDLLWPIVL